jgi:PAS domain-containing protein
MRGRRAAEAGREECVTTTLTDDPFSILQAVTVCGVIVWDVIDEAIIAANEIAAEILALPLRTLLGPAGHRRIRLCSLDGLPLPWEDWPLARALRTDHAQREVLVGVVSPDGRHHFVRMDAIPVRWRRDEGQGRWVVVSFAEVSTQDDPDRQRPATNCGLPGGLRRGPAPQ